MAREGGADERETVAARLQVKHESACIGGDVTISETTPAAVLQRFPSRGYHPVEKAVEESTENLASPLRAIYSPRACKLRCRPISLSESFACSIPLLMRRARRLVTN
jgi:hypothetical protein